MIIDEPRPDQLESVLDVHRQAFGSDVEAKLVRDLLADSAAEPLSLVESEGDKTRGHVLFTRLDIEGHPRLRGSLLAPLAVVAEAQCQGVGLRLIAEGLKRLAARRTDLVFVLGHPGYYPKGGFEQALPHHLEAPYPLAPEQADAWMVQALRPGVLGSAGGRVRVAAALMHPDLWRE